MTTQSLTTTEFSTAPGITESTHPWDICFVCSNGFIRTHKNAEVGIRSDVIYFFKSKLECAATCARNSKCKVFSFGLDGKCQVFIQVNTASMLTFPTPGTSIWERQQERQQLLLEYILHLERGCEKETEGLNLIYLSQCKLITLGRLCGDNLNIIEERLGSDF